MTRIAPLGLALLTLAACQAAPSKPSLPETCTPGYQSLVGNNIGAVTLPRNLPQRVIPPGTSYTEDHNPDRLNIFVDDKGWIARVTCG